MKIPSIANNLYGNIPCGALLASSWTLLIFFFVASLHSFVHSKPKHNFNLKQFDEFTVSVFFVASFSDLLPSLSLSRSASRGFASCCTHSLLLNFQPRCAGLRFIFVIFFCSLWKCFSWNRFIFSWQNKRLIAHVHRTGAKRLLCRSCTIWKRSSRRGKKICEEILVLRVSNMCHERQRPRKRLESECARAHTALPFVYMVTLVLIIWTFVGN